MLDSKTELELSFTTAMAMLNEQRPLELVVKPYAGLKASAEINPSRVLFKVSDAWAFAPEDARLGLALYLLLRLLRRRPGERENRFLSAYKAFGARESASILNDSLRRLKGRVSGTSPIGSHYDLSKDLELVLSQYAHVFEGHLPQKPTISWSKSRSKSRLGFYDSAFNSLVISKALDSLRVPDFVVQYVIFHELLHVKHRVLYERGESLRRTVHPRAFKEDERRFGQYDETMAWLKRNRL